MPKLKLAFRRSASAYGHQAAQLAEIYVLDRRHRNLQDQLKRLEGESPGLRAEVEADLERDFEDLQSLVWGAADRDFMAITDPTVTAQVQLADRVRPPREMSAQALGLLYRAYGIRPIGGVVHSVITRTLALRSEFRTRPYSTIA